MDDEKRDEEQVVEDTDADTRDVEESDEKEEEQTADDSAEVNRKLDALIEAVGLISKAVAQLSADSGAGTGFSQPAPESNDAEPVPDFDDMDLKI